MRFFMQIPVRIKIFILIGITRYMIESIAANFTLTLEYMVMPREKAHVPWCIQVKHNITSTSALETPKKLNCGPRYNWTYKEEILMQESFSWGYVFISIPAGILAEFLGPFYIIVFALGISAILNLIRVFVLNNLWIYVLIFEFLIGMNLGLVLPALYLWIARWAPPNERGIFVCSQTGGDLGVAMVRLLTRNLVSFIGWRGIYYLISSKVLVFCFVMFIVGSSSPENHSSITAQELRYIKKSQKGKVTSTWSVPPFGEILYSRAFWSINILHLGFQWALILQSHMIPHFLNRFIGLSEEQVAYLELFPPIGIIGTAILSAFIGDYIRTKNMFHDTHVAKTFVIVSHIFPGVVVFFMCMAYCSKDVVYLLLLLAVSFAGAGNISVRRTIVDISPNYVGTIFGFIECGSRLLGIAILRLEVAVLNYNRGIIGWSIIFLVGGISLIGTGVIYLFFGTDATQWWNQRPQDRRLIFKKVTDSGGKNARPPSRVGFQTNEENQKSMTQLELNGTSVVSKGPSQTRGIRGKSVLLKEEADDENLKEVKSKSTVKLSPKIMDIPSYEKDSKPSENDTKNNNTKGNNSK